MSLVTKAMLVKETRVEKSVKRAWARRPSVTDSFRHTFLARTIRVLGTGPQVRRLCQQRQTIDGREGGWAWTLAVLSSSPTLPSPCRHYLKRLHRRLTEAYHIFRGRGSRDDLQGVPNIQRSQPGQYPRNTDAGATEWAASQSRRVGRGV